MKLETIEQILKCILAKKPVYWSFDVSDWRVLGSVRSLRIDLDVFEYRTDAPVAYWEDRVLERWHSLKEIEGIDNAIIQSDVITDDVMTRNFDVYCGFIKGKYHIRMCTEYSWIGIWEKDDVTIT